MSRIRIKESALEQGSLQYLVTLVSNHRQQYERIEDNPPGMWGDLSIDKCRVDRVSVSGTGRDNRIFTNFCPHQFEHPTQFNWIDSPDGSPSNGAAATKILADTNPSRPVVSIPNFVHELREFPKLLKIEGDTLLRKAGSANLNYHFGWAPLIGDLTKLLSFSDQVSKRTKELEALFKSGLRRKRQLFNGSKVVPRYDWVQSNQDIVEYNFSTISTEKVWGYVEWYPSPGSIPPGTADEMRSLARQCVLGLTVDLSVAWEAMPWSWLIDWCSNTGDYLASKRNLVNASHGPVYIMRTRTGETHCRFLASKSRVAYPHVFRRRTTKSRVKSLPSISAQLPFLSMRQLSILGSIAVTRRAGRQSDGKLGK